MENTSKRWALNTIDWKKIGVGAGVAVGGALFTYFQQFITDVDFGVYGPIVMAVNSVVVNVVRKWIADNTL